MFRPSRSKRLPKARRTSLRVEQMEERALLSNISPVIVPPPVGTTPPIIVRPPGGTMPPIVIPPQPPGQAPPPPGPTG